MNIQQFAIYDFDNDVMLAKMNNEEYNIYCSLLLKEFRDSKLEDNIDAFTAFFNEIFYLSGKTTGTIDNEYTYTRKRISLIEFVAVNGNDVKYRIIPPAEVYLNTVPTDVTKYFIVNHYTSPQVKWEYKTHHWYSRDFSDWKKSDLSKDRWITDRPSFRKVRYRHELLALDDKFHEENDEPLARRPRYGKDEVYDRWEKPVSQTANWKNISKDKFQWQHNAQTHEEISNQVSSENLDARIDKLRDFINNPPQSSENE